MGTSLAEQLQRLATPQTSKLLESKKRDSILFDLKEAATKDRETIFEIGIRGLKKLILLNPSFSKFEQTLFDKTTLERSVENSDVNLKLNKSIKKFLLQLSPYFLQQPAHQCLEWLIRRYQINKYNIDELMALILPYHETMIFVKCVQIMKLQNEIGWDWIEPIRKPGVPLSKQTILNRAAGDPSFLRFISKTTIKAVAVLDTRAYSLQAMFAFYSTVTLGALDIAPKITDSHVNSISHALSKGLSSIVPDFCAASLMITGLLVTKTKLSNEFLDMIITKLANISHPRLQEESLMLLVIIHQTQNDCMKAVNEELLAKIIGNPSIPSTMGVIYRQNICVLPLCLPLITASLKNFQLRKKGWKLCKTFVESLLGELSLKSDDAEAVIR